MKLIIFTRPDDGGLSIIRPIQPAAEDEIARDLPDGAIDPCVIDESALPADREFRDAWRQRGAAVEIDMDAARAIHLARLRRARDARLKELDIDFTRAQGREERTAARAIENERQRLRDLPAWIGVEHATTPAELRALWPAELPR